MLAETERRLTAQRMREGVPRGNFGPDHIKAIHKHLFGDVYDWAGEFRTVSISKGGSLFTSPSEIQTSLDVLHHEIASRDGFRGMTQKRFAEVATISVAMLNSIHPFREGNGRTQIAWLMSLGDHAGHPIDPMVMQRHEWIMASKEAFDGYPGRMLDQVDAMVKSGAKAKISAIEGERRLTRDTGRDEPSR